ncbi:hypothetical protein [Shewanella donghaensis]|uniref:hypothetical protein n=1 Tax=Shewanella donghaensis TaxID=238836 RepID=UPI00118373B1|nr:hypothetical protein [Shewanella donghaensis]
MEHIQNILDSHQYIAFIMTLILGYIIALATIRNLIIGGVISAIIGVILIPILHLHIELDLSLMLIGIVIYAVGFISGIKYKTVKIQKIEKNIPKQIDTAKSLASRSFQVNKNSTILGKTLAQINAASIDVCFEMTMSNRTTDQGNKPINIGDVVTITGRNNALFYFDDNLIGTEIPIANSDSIIESNMLFVVENDEFNKESLQELKQRLNKDTEIDVCITQFERDNDDLVIVPELNIQRGDVIQFTGRPKDIITVNKILNP